ncbi:MAG: ribosomal protein S18-alanine N-acetyltransferase [Thermoanaerobaculia bacterium]
MSAASCSGDGLRIRVADARDLPALAHLEALGFADPWTAEQLFEFSRSVGARFWVATTGDGSLAGQALFREVAGEVELLRVVTAPEWRRQGVGCALLERALAQLDQEGLGCFLEVRADNLAAQALYGRLGFSRTGERRRYYRDDADAWLYFRPFSPAVAG